MPRKIVVMDLETDPFEYGTVVQPFVSGFYDGHTFQYFWGDDCVAQSIAYLRSLPESLIIYFHNGGKFDFYYYIDYFSGNLRVVNGRIIQAYVQMDNGSQHEFRDSYAIMPFPLKTYKKDDIDYDKMRPVARDIHRTEILDYLKNDCVYLRELCSTFADEFGSDRLTVGSASLKQLKRFHTVQKSNVQFDGRLRHDYYKGGRNQCFQTGVINMPVQVYDVNSMYPYVMRDHLHPVDSTIIISDRIESNTCFIEVEGTNHGAFPIRSKSGGLDFTAKKGTFYTTVHEYQAAIDTHTFETKSIKKTYGFSNRDTFSTFVDHFYSSRANAKKNGDFTRDLLFKFILNSAYGKFAQNPANYFDWKITPLNEPFPNEPCQHCSGSGTCIDCFCCLALNHNQPTQNDCMFCFASGFRWQLAETNWHYAIWQARLSRHNYLNVATGASITGAARAVLLRGIHASVDPLYCDTDSIICRELKNVTLSNSTLGAWKFEGSGDVTAIAGKKLYAVFSYTEPTLNDNDKRKYPWMLEPVKCNGKYMWCIKKAHKGARLSPAEILRVAQGDTIEVANPVPAYRLTGKHTFTKRKISRTA
jgi:Vibrio phage DNA polymerase